MSVEGERWLDRWSLHLEQEQRRAHRAEDWPRFERMSEAFAEHARMVREWMKANRHPPAPWMVNYLTGEMAPVSSPRGQEMAAAFEEAR